MPFSNGQKNFALIFILSFAALLVYAYWRDAKTHKVYYKRVWLILIIVILIMSAMFYITKKAVH